MWRNCEEIGVLEAKMKETRRQFGSIQGRGGAHGGSKSKKSVSELNAALVKYQIKTEIE